MMFNDFDLSAFWDIPDDILQGVWFLLSVALVLTFITFLARRMWEHVVFRRKHDPLWKSLWKTIPVTYAGIENQAALALMTYFIASSFYRGSTWMTLLESEAHGNLLSRSHVMTNSTLLALLGALCCVRVFTPIHWNPWLWMAVGASSIGVPIAVHYWV